MSLIGHWKLDGNALDSSGNGHHASSFSGSYVSGKLAQAGKGGTVDVPHSNELSLTDNFSLAFWIRRISDVTGYANHPFSKHAGTGASNWRCYVFGDGQELRFYGTRGGNWGSISASYTLPIDEWVHVVLIYKNGGQLFIDGNKVGGVTGGGTLSANTSSVDFLRSEFEMDDVRIYNHALSEKEIKELARAKVLHYDFDQFAEPTENLISSDNNYATGEREYSGTGYGIFSQTFDYSTHGIDDGDALTFSFEGKIDQARKDAGGTIRFYIWTYNSGDGWIRSTNIPCTNTFYERKFRTLYRDDSQDSSISSNGAPADGMKIGVYYHPNSNNTGTVWYRRLQAELKDHATLFVDGTRDGTVTDSSGQDNHAALALATTPKWTSESVIGFGIYEFDGTNRIQFPQISMNRNSATLSFWINLNSTGNQDLFGNTSGNGYYRMIEFRGTYMYCETDSNCHTFHSPPFPKTVTAGQWYQFAVVFDDRKALWYMDGESIGETTGYGSLNCDTPVSELSADVLLQYIGCGGYSGDLDGKMDDVRYYASALSADAIKELYQTRASIDSEGNLWV